MRGAIIQAALGLAIGIPVARLSVRLVEAQLYETKGVDASVLATAILTLTAAATLAGFIPARRPASTDRTQALRTQSTVAQSTVAMIRRTHRSNTTIE